MSESSAVKPATPARILIIEDEEQAVSILESFFLRRGYRVRSALDGVEGYDSFVKDGADLIITDLRMPRLDGYELLRRIRETHPKLPIIALTGSLNIARAEAQLRTMNIEHILPKPVDLKRIMEIVRSLGL